MKPMPDRTPVPSSFPAVQRSAARSSLTVVALIIAQVVALLVPASLRGAEEVKVRHILVRKRARAEQALDDLVNLGVNRDNFIRVARKYSLDAVTKGAGGDLGWNTRSKFVDEFSEVAFGLTKGEVSEPVRTRFGWHLIFVEDRRESPRGSAVQPPERPISVFNPPKAPDETTGAEDEAAPSPDALRPETSPSESPPSTSQPEGDETTASGDDSTTSAGATPEASDVAPPEPATGETTAPAVTPRVFMPERRLHVILESDTPRYSPSQGIVLGLRLENQGKQDIRVFHPDLLPLGLTVRSNGTPAEPSLDLSAVSQPESFLVNLKSRASTGRLIVLSDYFKDLPANTRFWVKWQGSVFIENFNKKFPGESAKIAGFNEAQAAITADRRELVTEVSGVFERLNRVGSPRSIQEVPVSIFEPLKPNETYYASMEFSGESRPIWFELYTEKQFNGVRHFANLAMEGFYDGLRIFDVRKGSYMRGGCPRNDGTAGPVAGYPRVANTEKIPHEKGTLSLVTRPASKGSGRLAGSIFFISLADHPEWVDVHVPIGKVVLNEDVLDRVSARNFVTIRTVAVVPESQAPSELRGAADAGDVAAAEGQDSDEPKILDGRGLPKVLIETSKGDMVVELYEDDARNTVASFISLARDGFFNPDPDEGKEALKILERQPGYYVRTGSPDNTDSGGPGYRIRNEVANNTRLHERGTLSMCLEVDPSTGKPVPNTAGSQFFICLDEVAFWNGLYTPFGKVTGGLDVLGKLEEGDTIERVKILEMRRNPYQPQTLPAR